MQIMGKDKALKTLGSIQAQIQPRDRWIIPDIRRLIHREYAKKPKYWELFGIKCFYKCPVCYNSDIYKGDNFCSECGQRLDWSEAE